jgi:thiol:disulfide interchange protein DsbA
MAGWKLALPRAVQRAASASEIPRIPSHGRWWFNGRHPVRQCTHAGGTLPAWRHSTSRENPMTKPLARLRLLALLGGLLLASSACTAAPETPAPFTEGDQYVTLPGPHERLSPEGKVEVVEVFSYGCIHCAHFAPIAEQLRKSLPKGVVFKLMPAPFNEAWLPFARAYYAAKQLGVVDRTHLLLFQAKFEQQYPINTLDELADFYASHGVNRAEFMRIANSPAATEQMKKDFALLQKWQIDGTPTLVVDGKYRTSHVKSLQELADLTQWLAKRELDGGK